MKLDIQKLKDGNYSFDFVKPSSELNFVEATSLAPEIRVRAEVEKRDRNIFIKAAFAVEASLLCDKCLGRFRQNIKDDFRLLYTVDRDFAPDGEDDTVKLIQAHTREVDLTAGLSESLMLAMPMKVVCSDDCRGLCPSCGTNLNNSSCTCARTQTDPRWEKLKELLD